MSELRLKKERMWTPKLGSTILFGFLIRLAVLILMIYVLDGVWDKYYIEDDVKFEELVGKYLYIARHPFDMVALYDLTGGYLSPFWIRTLCVTAKMFSTIYTGRYINICLSTLCIWVVYALTYTVSENKKTALLAARLFAFLPVTILTSCFPIKDIFLTFGVMYAYYTFVCFQSSRRVPIAQILLCAILLICVMFTRGAVTEILLLFLVVYLLQKLYREKKYVAALVLLMVSLVVFLMFRSSIMGSFETKMDTYGEYYADEAGGLNAIRFTGIRDIYKLPLAYAFAMLQPIQINLFTTPSDTRPWRTLMSYANITMYPVAVGAFLYMFSKKHNLFFWLSSFAMYSAIIMLSLGVARHYLFMLPVNLINFALYTSEQQSKRRTLISLGTFALFSLIFAYSLFVTMSASTV